MSRSIGEDSDDNGVAEADEKAQVLAKDKARRTKTSMSRASPTRMTRLKRRHKRRRRKTFRRRHTKTATTTTDCWRTRGVSACSSAKISICAGSANLRGRRRGGKVAGHACNKDGVTFDSLIELIRHVSHAGHALHADRYDVPVPATILSVREHGDEEHREANRYTERHVRCAGYGYILN